METSDIKQIGCSKLFLGSSLFKFVVVLILNVSVIHATEHEPPKDKTYQPRMIKVPSGSFQMGSDCCEREDELPIHPVTIKAFKMSQTEVTFAMWDRCVTDGVCTYKPSDQGWGRGNRPVINVSYQHITKQFIPWINKVSGQTFRLPSEAEWEYAARAGSTTKYAWGNEIDCSQAQYGRSEPNEGNKLGGECSKSYDGTVEVKSYSPNRFGLYDMNGNAWELVEDCYHESYKEAPNDGSAWVSGDCKFERVIRGGGWYTTKNYLRSADRNGLSSIDKSQLIGFRLAQDIVE
ncbi:formylglycine-generating enzyme family protein [Aliikangiella sp. IMCC44653]